MPTLHGNADCIEEQAPNPYIAAEKFCETLCPEDPDEFIEQVNVTDIQSGTTHQLIVKGAKHVIYNAIDYIDENKRH